MGRSKGDRARLFSVVSRDRTRGHGHKLKYSKCHLNVRPNFFTVGMVEHWRRLPREVVESPSLEVLKNLTGHSSGQPAEALSRGLD